MKKIDRDPIINILDIDQLDIDKLLGEVIPSYGRSGSITAFAYNDYVPNDDTTNAYCMGCINHNDNSRPPSGDLVN